MPFKSKGRKDKNLIEVKEPASVQQQAHSEEELEETNEIEKFASAEARTRFYSGFNTRVLLMEKGF